jgi:MATE family multidrug resistance protein
MIAMVAANLVNIAGNWIFVFGNLGAPRLGAVGSAWSTVMARTLMAAMVAIAVFRKEPELRTISRRLDLRRVRELLKLGAPAAGQIGAEMFVWAIATVLAGRLAATSLAGHQIAVTIVSTTFMLPLGVSSAAAVRVGHAMGRGDPRGAAHSGWMAVGLGAAIMSLCALALIGIPQFIARLFTPDAVIVAAAVPTVRRRAGRHHGRVARSGQHVRAYDLPHRRLRPDRAAARRVALFSRRIRRARIMDRPHDRPDPHWDRSRDLLARRLEKNGGCRSRDLVFG